MPFEDWEAWLNETDVRLVGFDSGAELNDVQSELDVELSNKMAIFAATSMSMAEARIDP